MDVNRALKDCSRILADTDAAYIHSSHVSGSRDDDCITGGADWDGAKTDRSYLMSIGPTFAAAAGRRIMEVWLKPSEHGVKWKVVNAETVVLDDTNAKVARSIFPRCRGMWEARCY